MKYGQIITHENKTEAIPLIGQIVVHSNDYNEILFKPDTLIADKLLEVCDGKTPFVVAFCSFGDAEICKYIRQIIEE